MKKLLVASCLLALCFGGVLAITTWLLGPGIVLATLIMSGLGLAIFHLKRGNRVSGILALVFAGLWHSGIFFRSPVVWGIIMLVSVPLGIAYTVLALRPILSET